MHYLVHVHTGPENPTKAALAFLVAKTVLDEGHQLSMFIAGDGVNLLRNEVVETLEGIGTGALASHVDAIKASNADIFYSGLSAKARGLTSENIVLSRAQPAMPAKLLSLTAEADRVLCY